MDQLPRGLAGQVLVEHGLEAFEPVRVLVVEVGHERVAVAAVQELHERPRGAVVGERLEPALVVPDRQGVLRPAERLWNLVRRRLQEPPAQERLDVAVPRGLLDRPRREAVPRDRDRVVREALVHPRRLTGARPELEQVLVLVREDALVLERLRRAVLAQHRRGLVRRVRARAVRPVVRVDRHHVPVHERVDVGGVVARDVRREVDVQVVLVLEVRDQRHDLVAGPLEVALGEERRRDVLELRVRPVATRRRAELLRHLRIHVLVELPAQVRRLRIGDHVADAVVAAVAGRRVVEVVRDPDLDLVADRAEREVGDVELARVEVDQRPDLHGADRRALLRRRRGLRRNGRGRNRRGQILAPRLLHLDVPTHVDAVASGPVAVPVARQGSGRYGQGKGCQTERSQ